MATVIARGKKQWFRAWQMVTLLALAARTSLTDGASDIFYVGDYDNMVVILEITSSATDAGDVLDVKIDGSWDLVTWYNLGEFTQQAGNGSAASEMMQFRKGGVVADEDAILVLTSDAGATVVRPSMCPPYIRATSTIARVTGTDESHTFSVIAHVQ